MPKDSITIVICTFQRNELLRKCLDALAVQSSGAAAFTTLVVDNAGTDSCKKLCEAYSVGYVREEQTGVSHARNRGVREVKSGWIFFLDDDGIPAKNLITSFIKIIENESIQVVGGKYCHYFDQPPPKWLRLYYTECHQAVKTDSLTIVPNGSYLSIGIMAIKKTLMVRVGAFSTDLGMTGRKFGYGEEDELQDRIRNNGTPIYYSSTLAMDHLVSPRKYTVLSRIKMAHAHGLAKSALAGNQNYGVLQFAKDLLRITFITIPYDIARLFFRPGFYWQNAVVSTLSKYSYAWGKILSARKANAGAS